MCQTEVHDIHHGKGLDCAPVVSRSLEHHTGDDTFWLVSTPILREMANLRRGLAARWLFRVTSCCEGTTHLQIAMPSPGFEPRSYGTSVSIANHR
ncbi:hypothetical protein TNCV_4385891 [Trichonephila clavipes]|nr:hypothetical protein TNCV_4385891 [Trichonephila clavipes]